MDNTNKDLVWDLTQLAFLASFNGSPEKAIDIFEGLDLVYKNNTGIKSGLAMSYFFSGKFKKAISLYRNDILIAEPQNYDARCFLGMALWEEGEKEEAKNLVEDAFKHGDEDVKMISQSFLGNMK
jgi:tetratricopeptide (TPR) repeat protein